MWVSCCILVILACQMVELSLDDMLWPLHILLQVQGLSFYPGVRVEAQRWLRDVLSS